MSHRKSSLFDEENQEKLRKYIKEKIKES